MISDPLELNYSKVKAYLDCPLLYRYIYVERRFAPLNPYASLGLSVHGALARYHASGGDLSDLLVYYADSWNNRGYSTAQQSMEFYNRGAKILENYWLAAQAEKNRTVFSEKIFQFAFEKWRVRGTIDRVDRLDGDCFELIDYKMGFEEKTPADAAQSLQLAIYALGLKRALNITVTKVSFFILNGPYKVSAGYDGQGDEKTLALLRDTGEKMLAMDFSRTGNCPRCPIKNLCPQAVGLPEQKN
ncbi:MAG TPA: hypothetical protein DCL44_03050 [Elusimicrobia bacterium]|nr:hypothetical protein [Elusimicrobiota bacterium]